METPEYKTHLENCKLKTSMRAITFICCLLLLTLSCSEPSGGESLLTPQQMRDDVLFVFNIIGRTHPNPYQVLNSKQYGRLKRKILNRVKKPMNVYDFWVTLAQIHPFIDAHTGIDPPQDIAHYLNTTQWAYFPPGAFLIRGDSLYFGVIDGIPDSLKHKQILKINRKPTNKIIHNVAKYISHESLINLTNILEMWGFSILYPLLYQRPQPLNIKYADEESIKEVQLNSSDFLNWITTYRKVPYMFRYNRAEKMALFELNTFTGNLAAYNKEIGNAIDSLRSYDIQNLFIDISCNGGGSDEYSFLLLNFLLLPEQDISKYQNNAYLIQSNYTFSAAVTVSDHFKYFNIGPIIGEETGGLTACYIDSKIELLPNSKLKLRCATKKTVIMSGGKWDGRGVLPDIAYPLRETCRYKSFTWEELNDMLSLVNNSIE